MTWIEILAYATYLERLFIVSVEMEKPRKNVTSFGLDFVTFRHTHCMPR